MAKLTAETFIMNRRFRDASFYYSIMHGLRETYRIADNDDMRKITLHRYRVYADAAERESKEIRRIMGIE